MQNMTMVKRIGFIAIGLLLIIYIIFQLFYSKIFTVKTDIVTKTTSYDSYETKGFVVRDETMVQNDLGGAAIFTVDDGYAIAKGEPVANIYSSTDDVRAQEEIKSLEIQKNNLNQLKTGSSSFERDLDRLNKQIYGNIDEIEAVAEGGSLYNTSAKSDSLSYMLNERQLVMGKAIDFDTKIAQIDDRINTLNSTHGAQIGTVLSPQAGYFISQPDGYENIVSYKNVKSITVDQIDAGFAKQDIPADTIGKVATHLKWYVVCKIQAEKCSSYRLGDGVTLSLPYSTNTDIPASVVAVNQKTGKDPAAVVFECDYMNSDMAKARNEEVRIHSNEYMGLRVSKDAIHIKEVTAQIKDETTGQYREEKRSVQGVYVLYGNQLIFKQIVPLYAYSTYVICNEMPKPDEIYTKTTVQIYDKVVVGGTNLYDGKFIS